MVHEMDDVRRQSIDLALLLVNSISSESFAPFLKVLRHALCQTLHHVIRGSADVALEFEKVFARHFGFFCWCFSR